MGKESAQSAGDPGLIPDLGRSPEEGYGKPLQYSCLENSMDRGAWRATVHGIARIELDVMPKPPEGEGPFKQAIMYDYINKNNEKQVKETVSNMESKLASSLQQFLTVKVHSTILWKKWVMTVLLSQVDLSGSVCHHDQCFKCCDLFSFCSSFGKCLFYTCRLRYAELQIHKTASQVNKFSAFLCME